MVLTAHTEQFAQSASQLESVKMHPWGLLSKTYLEEYTLSHSEKDQRKRSKVAEAAAHEKKEEKQKKQQK